MTTDGIEKPHGMAIVVVEVKNRDAAWQVAEEIRVILGHRAKVVEPKEA